jgi:hypothetical protein
MDTILPFWICYFSAVNPLSRFKEEYGFAWLPVISEMTLWLPN